MIKALFLDMDETLCDTTGANLKARKEFKNKVASLGRGFDADSLADDYLAGIYKRLPEDLKEILFPITDEETFRTDLLHQLYVKHKVPVDFDRDHLHEMRQFFDSTRLDFFGFYPGVENLLKDLRSEYKLVVITNGPIYSQHPKIKTVDMHKHVDHVIVGGEEPEEKPFISIFEKACRLADCEPGEAIHFGDSLEADIKGANNAGIKSVWINPDGMISKDAHHTIGNFIEAPSVLNHYKS